MYEQREEDDFFDMINLLILCHILIIYWYIIHPYAEDIELK